MRSYLVLIAVASFLICSCAVDDKFPWTDPDTGLIWSARTPSYDEEWPCSKKGSYTYEQAFEYCESLGEGWRLPSINELRTLIRDCPWVEYPRPEGFENWCEVNIDEDSYYAPYTNDFCWGCGGDRDETVFILDDVCDMWSSTKVPTFNEPHAQAYYLRPWTGTVSILEMGFGLYVRCVK